MKITPEIAEQISFTGSDGRLLVGDAAEFANKTGSVGEYDLCYVSGFTPDEQRRNEIQIAYRSSSRSFAASVMRQVPLFGKSLGPQRTWPSKAEPFSPMVMRILDGHLAPGGLFISQSYYCGVDLRANPHYVEDMRLQLRTIGIELVEVYHFMPDWTAVSLTIGIRATPATALDYARSLRTRPALSNFHGRSDAERTIHRIDCLARAS